jgi:hypothetical protein
MKFFRMRTPKRASNFRLTGGQSTTWKAVMGLRRHAHPRPPDSGTRVNASGTPRRASDHKARVLRLFSFDIRTITWVDKFEWLFMQASDRVAGGKSPRLTRLARDTGDMNLWLQSGRKRFVQCFVHRRGDLFERIRFFNIFPGAKVLCFADPVCL